MIDPSLSGALAYFIIEISMVGRAYGTYMKTTYVAYSFAFPAMFVSLINNISLAWS